MNVLQIVYCKFSPGVLQVVYRLFADYLHTGSHILTYPVVLCHYIILAFKISVLKKKRVTKDGRTDRPSYRVASSRLKTQTEVLPLHT